MTVDELLSRHATTNDGEDGSVESHPCYGVIRPQRERAIMLELRKKDGSVLGLPYAMIEQIRFSESDGIRILACGREIRIAGRNLNSDALPKVGVLKGLMRHRVAWIVELPRSAVTSRGADQAATVESIDW